MYVTSGLLEGLLSMADDHDPNQLEVDLGTTPTARLPDDLGVPDDATVFTHFYLPDAGASVSAVFGFDLGTGPGQTDGRFISHPGGELAVRSTDELHQRMLVAVPPYDRNSVGAFDRAGRRHPLEVLDIALPEEPFE